MKFVVLSKKDSKKLIGLSCILLLFLVCYFSSSMYHYVKAGWGCPLSEKSIVIDPGHGGPDSGAIGVGGIIEKEVTLKIGYYLKDFLLESGAHVVLTRQKDMDLADPLTDGLGRRKAEDLRKRVQIAQSQDSNLLVSIHLNAIPSPRWSGAQTFYNPQYPKSKKLSEVIQKELISNLENTNRFAKKKNDVYILNKCTVPAAIVEVGFLSNPSEAKLLSTTSYQKKVAAAIYYGILRYYEE